jgi:hypothetical protein
MKDDSSTETDRRKKAIFDQMSDRRKQHILKIGYENWDPFQAPKDPIDMRRDKTRRTTQELIRAFLRSRSFDEYSAAYGRGVYEICMGIINGDERYLAMYEFSCWYRELLVREGQDEDA